MVPSVAVTKANMPKKTARPSINLPVQLIRTPFDLGMSETVSDRSRSVKRGDLISTAAYPSVRAVLAAYAIDGEAPQIWSLSQADALQERGAFQ